MFFGKNRKSYSVFTAGAGILKQIAKPVPAVTDEIRALAADMLAAMRVFNGIGLAAPQYGHALRLVVFDISADSSTGTPGEALLLPKMPLAVVNPEIVASSSQLCEREEGCLSVPDIFAPVIRPERVVFRAQTLDGEWIEAECGGLLGRCIQHELDHLEGKLFTDRLTPEAARAIRGDLERLERIGQSTNYRRKSR